MTSSHSKKGFQFAIITIVTFLLFLLLQFLAANEKISLDFYRYVSGFLMILVFVSSIIGFVFSMKGLKDPNSVKKIFGIIANSILFLLFVVTVVMRYIDFKNAL
ncbi:hypothetical protein [Psychroserpens luteolus]|uniref:hypothetical protein n=1 Tax=Psychroserpens luteolus TaxID=2855840 RepID=UPI001E3E29A5|nr:hypothetical protein [Psychroserpens luteolus]MCD2258950.1 hypothetical protein [Psychroserpens luteolus]